MRTGRPEEVLNFLKPGRRVFIQGGPGECQTFIDLLKSNPGCADRIELWSCLIPGINTFDYGSLPGSVSLTTFMASTTLEPSIASGRTTLRAMPYSEIGALLSRTEFDLAILHCAPPRANEACSFGISCDAAPIAWPKARRRVAFMNHRMPSPVLAESFPANTLDLAIEIDAPLLAAPSSGAQSSTLDAIARHAIALVPDGVTVQSGIGDTPAAVVAALRHHRGLRIHSGIITSEYRELAEAGVLDETAAHLAGIAWGDATFYDWLGQSNFAMRSIRETHGHDRLSALPNFVSIGSALEVDLAGNLNLEWRGARRVSSVGGAPDYLRGAMLSPGGRSIIALAATAGNGASRIVPRIASPSIAAELTDTIVTEHGVVRLRGLDASARARALISIAAPEHRDMLSSEQLA